MLLHGWLQSLLLGESEVSMIGQRHPEFVLLLGKMLKDYVISLDHLVHLFCLPVVFLLEHIVVIYLDFLA